jgi:hypothetical protein
LLVEHLLAPVRYRHLTCTFAGPLAVPLAYDRALLGRVLRCVDRRLDQDIRHRVKQEHRLPSVATLHTGTFSVVQRFRFDLAIYLHLHAMWTDGAFDDQDSSFPRWRAAPTLTQHTLQAIVGRIDADLDAILDEDDDFDSTELRGVAVCLQLGRSPTTTADPSPPSHKTTQALLAKGCRVCLHAAPSFEGHSELSGIVAATRELTVGDLMRPRQNRRLGRGLLGARPRLELESERFVPVPIRFEAEDQARWRITVGG